MNPDKTRAAINFVADLPFHMWACQNVSPARIFATLPILGRIRFESELVQRFLYVTPTLPFGKVLQEVENFRQKLSSKQACSPLICYKAYFVKAKMPKGINQSIFSYVSREDITALIPSFTSSFVSGSLAAR